MLDTNCIDALLKDIETYSALLNRKDIRLLVTQIQIEELQAIPEAQKRQAALAIAKTLCSTLTAPSTNGEQGQWDFKHAHDKAILAASKHCRMLVSNDLGLLNLANANGKRAITWSVFVKNFVFSAKKF